MASKKKLTGAALAQSKVIDTSKDSRFKLSLPVNEGFADPNEVDRTRGVDYEKREAPENREAERGIGAAVLAGLFPANLSRWIAETAARKRGLPGLAADLVAILPNEKQKPTKKLDARAADVAAMLRALQRSAPAHKEGRKEEHKGGIRKALYRERIARLRLREARDVVIGVRGYWRITELSKTGYISEDATGLVSFRVFNSDPSIPVQLQEARAVLEAGGAGFIETVIASANGIVRGDKPETLQEMIQATQARASAELLRTHELRVEVSV